MFWLQNGGWGRLIHVINLYTGKYGKLAAQNIEDVLQTSTIKNNFS